MEDLKKHIENNDNLSIGDFGGNIAGIKNILKLMSNTYKRFFYIYECPDDEDDEAKSKE